MNVNKTETSIAVLSGKPPKKKKSTLKRKENLIALAFISIKYLGLIVFTVLPFIFAILYSFTDYNARNRVLFKHNGRKVVRFRQLR